CRAAARPAGPASPTAGRRSGRPGLFSPLWRRGQEGFLTTETRRHGEKHTERDLVGASLVGALHRASTHGRAPTRGAPPPAFLRVFLRALRVSVVNNTPAPCEAPRCDRRR